MTEQTFNTAAEKPRHVALGVMVLTAAFFSTNIIFGRYISGETSPFALACARWFAVCALLMPFAFGQRHQIGAFIKDQFPRLVLMGIFGMGVCGGGVYWALQYTSATNATLIYSTAPLLIITLEGLLRGRRTSTLEIFGTVLAFIGVAIIVARGSWSTIATLSFNIGDVMIAAAALSWAFYSLIYKSTDMRGLKPVSLFMVMAFFGGLVNLPLAAYELATAPVIPDQLSTWLAIGGIIFVSSLLAFTGYQFGIRALGPSLAGVFMYLMTPFGVLMAIIFLGETLAPWHIIGISAVVAGIVLAVWASLRRSA